MIAEMPMVINAERAEILEFTVKEREFSYRR